jgi:hypothetical protein
MPHDRPSPGSGATSWLAGGGEMGARIRTHAWASTPLGPLDAWPDHLRHAVRIMLASKTQICLFWGPDLVKLYNDAYIPVLGQKHPWALGRPGREVWSEIWDVLGPLLSGVVASGEAFRGSDYPFYLARHGFTEETYFDISYDPVRDDAGRVDGVLCIVTETTGRVLSERRIRTLRDLGRARAGTSTAEACVLALGALSSNPKDVPFAALYLIDEDGATARAQASIGVDVGGALSPAEIAVDDPRWDLGAVARSGRAAVVALDGGAASAAMPGAAPERTLVLPIVAGGSARASWSRAPAGSPPWKATTATSSTWSPPRSAPRSRRPRPTRRSASARRPSPSSTGPRPPSSATSVTSSAPRSPCSSGRSRTWRSPCPRARGRRIARAWPRCAATAAGC